MNEGPFSLRGQKWINALLTILHGAQFLLELLQIF